MVPRRIVTSIIERMVDLDIGRKCVGSNGHNSFCNVCKQFKSHQISICFKLLGPFKVGYTKRNVLPQNHYQNTILNDRYIYEIIFLVDFLIKYSHTS
jgi:hypothetical protein